jgi:hypothetical protein
MKNWWNNYWFADEPYFDLGFMRLGVVGLQLITLIGVQFDKLAVVVSLSSVLYHPVALIRFVMAPWGWLTLPDTRLMIPLYWVTVLAGFMALIGLRTTLSMIVLTAGSLFLQAYLFSFTEFHHNEAVLLLALTALALAPCGRALSIDSLITRRSNPAAPRIAVLDYRGPYAGWPIKFVQWLFPLIYISAVISKIAANGYTLHWANGFTLQYYFLQDSLRKPEMALGLWVSQFHDLILISQIVVLFYQATYFLVVPFPKLRWIYLPVGLFFHFANYYALRAQFPEWILLLGVYVPWSVAFKKLLNFEVAAPEVQRASRADSVPAPAPAAREAV